MQVIEVMLTMELNVGCDVPQDAYAQTNGRHKVRLNQEIIIGNTLKLHLKNFKCLFKEITLLHVLSRALYGSQTRTRP